MSTLIQYHRGSESLAFYILKTCESTFQMWLKASELVMHVNLANSEKLIHEISETIKMIEEETLDVIETIQNEERTIINRIKLVSDDPNELVNILRVSKFAFQIKPMLEIPFFTLKDMKTLKSCDDGIAQDYINLMESCGINFNCAYYKLIKAIIQFSNTIEIKIDDQEFLPILETEPFEYEHLCK